MAAEFVVLGAGSSGCAVAGRLAEAGHDVLVVEAGPDYGPFGDHPSKWPAELLSARMLATTHDWGYHSGRWTFERAKVIGGCSSHNGAIAAVGLRSDYDNWQLAGWSAAEVAPLFDLVIERMRVRAKQVATWWRRACCCFRAQAKTLSGMRELHPIAKNAPAALRKTLH